jgi:D-threo-aldose 1-dehydrogenase
VAAVIPGPRTADEVQQNAALMQAAIPGALWADLRQAGLLPENAPTREK